MKTTPEVITSLNKNEIFIFGSNSAGRHGLGAAKTAKDKFGAEYGVGKGLTGRCYAFPTKYEYMGKYLRTLPLDLIREEFIDLFSCCDSLPEYEFLLTKVGTGLAGYSVKDIVGCFKDLSIPANLSMPAEFWKELDTYKTGNRSNNAANIVSQ